MNAVFHLGALVAALALGWGLLRAQKQRDLLRRLAGGGQKVEVEGPAEFLRGFAGAAGITSDLTGPYGLSPRRIQGRVLFELFSARGISLIRCLKPSADPSLDLLVEITTQQPCIDAGERATRERAVAAALGDRIVVKLLDPSGPAKGG